MRYIWNRIERVSSDRMPDIVEKSFKDWVKEQNALLNKATLNKNNKEEVRIKKLIKNQENKYTENMRKYYFPQSFR